MRWVLAARRIAQRAQVRLRARAHAVSSRPAQRSQPQLLHWPIGYICPLANVIGALG